NFNVTFLITMLFNIISAYVLWHEIFQSKAIAFFGGLTTAFSPFVFIMMAHFQMITLWPLFIGLTLLMKYRNTWKAAVISGIFAGVLFYGSVYLSLMMCFMVGVWYLVS